MFEKKLTELQRANTADSLKDHAKYAELEEHIQNAVRSTEGWYITQYTQICTTFNCGFQMN